MDLAALLEEFARRNPEAAAHGELGGRVPTEDEVGHPGQWGMATSLAMLNAVLCSRQWGKTTGARLITKLTVAKPKSRTIYGTLIRRNCKKLFWDPLLQELDEAGWRVTERVGGKKRSNDTDLMLTAPNGAFVQAVSINEMSDLKTIRVDQADAFIVDECQEPNDEVLQALIFKVALPMLMKRNGRLWAMGTVPDSDDCCFTQLLDDPAWRTFGHSEKKGTPAISAFDNPHMDPASVRRVCDEAGLHPGHPVYEREFMGRRVSDPSKRAYEYMAGRNDYDPADVDFTVGEWRNAGGLDLGFQDADAIVLGSWNRQDPERRLYERWQWLHNHLDYEDLKDVMAVVTRAFPGFGWVGDHGGHGATKVLESLKTRLHMMLFPKPPDVMVSVGLVNDDFRTSRLLIALNQKAVTKRLLDEVQAMPWDDKRKERIARIISAGAAQASIARDTGKVTKSINPQTKKAEINKKGFHSDITEALRYMHHAARHYLAKPAKPEPTEDERRTQRLLAKAAHRRDPFSRPRLVR